MKAKIFEIRYKGTHINVAAIEVRGENDIEKQHIKKAGYPTDTVIVMNLGNFSAGSRPAQWQSFFMSAAHQYIQDNFFMLESGSIIDVDYVEHVKYVPVTN